VNGLLAFLTRWSPHVWLAFSIFGAMLSGTLFHRAVRTLAKIEGAPSADTGAWHYWRRHAASHLVMHLGFIIVGLVAVAQVQSVWAALLTLTILLAIPIVLAWRSYDSLRFMGAKRDE
jgi:hypothetical protein